MKKNALLFLALASFALVGCSNGSSAANESKYTEDDMVLNVSSASLDLGESITLSIANAKIAKSVVWETSDSMVASVSFGTVHGENVGTCTISATYGGMTSVCAIEVYDSYAKPYISVSVSEVSLSIGSTYSVSAETYYKGEKQEGLSYEWNTNDSSVAFVDADNEIGTIVAAGSGETNVSVRTLVGYRLTEAVRVIPVKVYSNVVYFDVSNADPIEGGYETTLTKGGTYAPDVKVYVDGILMENPSLVWSVSDTAVLSNDGGTFKALKKGSALIYGNYKNISTLSITVNVK